MGDIQLLIKNALQSTTAAHGNPICKISNIFLYLHRKETDPKINSTEKPTTAINLLVTKVNELIEHTNETRKELVRQNIELQKLRLKADLLIGASDSSSQFQQDLFALKKKYKRSGFLLRKLCITPPPVCLQ